MAGSSMRRFATAVLVLGVLGAGVACAAQISEDV